MKYYSRPSLRKQLEAIREAHAALPYKPPDPNDPVAVRWDNAQRLFNFMKYKIEEDGGRIEDYRYNTVRHYYDLLLAREAAEGGES